MIKNLYSNSNLFKLPDNQFKRQFNHDEHDVNFLIFVKTDKPIENELLEMLINIIKALKIQKNEAEIILFNNEIIMSNIINKYKVNKVLCFGAETKDLNINMDLTPFKLYRFSTYQLLMIYDLVDVYNNKKYKATLWSLLQKMFNL